MLEPLASEGHEPTVTVSSETLPEGLGTNDWIDRALARQQATLETTLIERRPLDRSHLAGRHTLSSFVRGDDVLVLDQWWHHRPSRGWTITVSCLALDYGHLREGLQALADSFEPS